MISYLLIIPLIGISIIIITPSSSNNLIKQIAFLFSSVAFIFSLFLWIFFDNSTSNFQYIEFFNWSTIFNINFFFGIDGISLFFILLTTLLTYICILISWMNVKKQVKSYMILFLLIEFFLIIVFSILDIVAFYVFFESILIPMFFIIGIWGSRTRKLKAAYQFFLYTLLGSLFMLLAIFVIFFETGVTDFLLLNNFAYEEEKETFLWLAFFFSFSIKVPMVPFHIWLPEAHVEAPTSGSVVLAGILLKMGTYGLLRFLICLFPCSSIFFTPLVFTMSIIAIIYTSLTTIRQVDLKKIIAYSSIAHMGFVTIGIFSFNLFGVEGSLIIMLSHGFVSSGLFLCIGVLYERHHTRLIKYYSGIGQVMPIFSSFFLFFSISNLAFPATSSFVGEFLTLVGCLFNNTFTALLALTTMVLGAVYSLWFCNRILFGFLSVKYIIQYTDVNRREFACLFPLVFCVVWLGVYPETFIESMHLSIMNLLQKF
jgi:proton-translocating NADH-quinone oxidoreductase chain M